MTDLRLLHLSLIACFRCPLIEAIPRNSPRLHGLFRSQKFLGRVLLSGARFFLLRLRPIQLCLKVCQCMAIFFDVGLNPHRSSPRFFEIFRKLLRPIRLILNTIFDARDLSTQIVKLSLNIVRIIC